MSILIKGMEMPTNECITVTIAPSGAMLNYIGKELSSGTAVNVPPHGRLIDADALKDKEIIFNRDEWEDTFDDGLLFVTNLIDDAPTIIPAEEGE